MPKETRAEVFVKSWSKRFMYVAMAAVAIMLIVSVIDMVGLKLLAKPIPGGVDIIGLVAVFIASFGISTTELVGGHVRLDLGLVFLPKRMQDFCRKLSHILSIFLFVLLLFASIKYAISLMKSGEASMTIAIPFYPFVLSLVVGCIPILLVFVMELIKPEQIKKEVDKL